MTDRSARMPALSLSSMAVRLGQKLDSINVIDRRMATRFIAGLVAFRENHMRANQSSLRASVCNGLLLIATSFCSMIVVSSEQAEAAGSSRMEDGDWPLLGRTADMQHNSPLRDINETSVKNLGLAWFSDIPSRDGLVGNPLVVDGVVYQGGPMGRIYATDIRSGELIWTFSADPLYEGSSLATFWSTRFNRGVAVQDDKVFIAVGDCRLVAVNRHSGAKIWESVSCDRTDRSGLYGITGAPRVGGGLVYIGNNCIDSGNGRGFVDAFEAKTGRRKWRFYTVPNDPTKRQENKALEMAATTWGTDWYKKSHGCGSVWDAITYDEKLGLLYVGTAGPAPWNPRARASDAGDELFTNSIVAIKADSGEYVWHYKTTPNDAWNFDATMHIMVAELPVQGERRRVVMTAPKNGFFYVLDAQSGKFLSAKNFTPLNWASHIDENTGRPVTLPDARYWEKPDGKAIVSPGPLGAHNWQAMSHTPETGLVYIPVQVVPTLMEIDPKSKPAGMLFDMYYGSGKDPKWKAFGELVAWDPVSQKERWRVKRQMPVNGGILTTSGGLVFQGTADGRFDAFSARTGELLWTFNAGSSIQGAPTTVEVDGSQVILVPAGNSASASLTTLARYSSTPPKTLGQSRLLAFKLGGDARLPLGTVIEFQPPPRPRQPDALARKGSVAYIQNSCQACHGRHAETVGGSVPDLRRASGLTHDMFAGIVIGGLRKGTGMPAFPGISVDDLRALQAYLINLGWDAYDAQEKAKSANASARP